MNDDEKPCTCAPEGTVGVEVQNVYDGVLFWECRECGARWHRFPEGNRLRGRAERVWAQWAANA